MTALPLHFELPANLSAKKFLNKLSKKLEYQIAEQQYTIKTYYDTFDWRLYRAGIICEFTQSPSGSLLNLIDRNSCHVIAAEQIQDVPAFCKQFQNARIRQLLQPVMEMRALSPLCQLPHELYSLNVLNKDQKTVLRIKLDEYELLPNRVCLYPLKGYDKAVKKVGDILQQSLELTPSECTILKTALKVQGRKPKDYTSKLTIELKPGMRADKACKMIYRQLLQTMQINEAGTIADIDTEYLHDFRVAVRRTRAGLSQIKNTLPRADVAKHAEFFAWLGQITGPTRDLDVYLLSYQQYKAALPLSLREDISPLYGFLKEKQVKAQKEMAEKLTSSSYRSSLVAWEDYLKASIPKKAEASHAAQAIKELADQRIWKVYKRLLKEGNAINDDSPAVALHDLRKTCKKLRYLIEFFQSLYAADKIKLSLRALKDFQTVLGDFQDYEIQEINIKEFSEEMMLNGVPSNTFLAMGVLVQYLDTKKCAARHDFSEKFRIFKLDHNQAIFKQLFAEKVA